ncbi:hypothetical protein EDEG_02685 [Edhazardia aedis USNM 41457]|uniref:Serine/threonine-protein phosphatase n=1 Tax=Edhazardia aedis (strain USNM 41457) TaxID=1003232 RepID=J9DJX4_EDHAE|nr:hypothetical protein EDEG_02685 [Edhazardia aedis USNM 41457]|eukprot:EJW02920.1 hypothetical protein EDEG_02685 [Edhazardia aedis USNM 41457]
MEIIERFSNEMFCSYENLLDKLVSEILEMKKAGNSHFHAKDYEKALKEYQKALQYGYKKLQELSNNNINGDNTDILNNDTNMNSSAVDSSIKFNVDGTIDIDSTIKNFSEIPAVESKPFSNEESTNISTEDNSNTILLEDNSNCISIEENHNNSAIQKNNNSISMEDNNNSISIENHNNSAIQKNNNSISIEDNNNSISIQKNNNSISIEENNNSISIEDNNNSISIEDNSNNITIEDESKNISSENLLNKKHRFSDDFEKEENKEEEKTIIDNNNINTSNINTGNIINNRDATITENTNTTENNSVDHILLSSKNIQFLDDKTNETRKELAFINYNMAVIYYNRKEYKLAIEKCNESINLFESTHARIKLCLSLYKNSQNKEAEAILKKFNLVHSDIKKITENLHKNTISNTTNRLFLKENFKKKHFIAGEFQISTDLIFEVVKTSLKSEIVDPHLLHFILLEGYKAFSPLDNVIHVNIDKNEHAYVFGDTHGQFIDTFSVISQLPNVKIDLESNTISIPANVKLIFNGDFVDRGKQSVENFIFLLLLKLYFPNNIFLNRGNHEFSSCNISFGFHSELKQKYYYDYLDLINSFNDIFKTLPIATILNKNVFIVHGGLPSTPIHIEEIDKLDRRVVFQSTNDTYNGLMWSDPADIPDFACSKRGIGVLFGKNITSSFFLNNDIKLLVRSHEYVPSGFKTNHDGAVITVFSAPNYCGLLGGAAYLDFNFFGGVNVDDFLFYNVVRFTSWVDNKNLKKYVSK